MLTPKEHTKLKQYVNGIDVRRMATAFDALGEPNRCLLFRAALQQDNVSVSQLASVVNISESLASQHLKVLMQAELLDRTKQGKHVYYTLNQTDPLVKAIIKAVDI